MIFYHEGRPGEVSHEAAEQYIVDILSNPFTTGRLLARLADAPWTRSRRSLCAPGVMDHYLKAAALRKLTQGEG
jgi:hypothetical protein